MFHDRDLCKTPPFAQLRCQVHILILEIFNIFLRLKFSPSLHLNKIEHFSKVSDLAFQVLTSLSPGTGGDARSLLQCLETCQWFKHQALTTNTGRYSNKAVCVFLGHPTPRSFFLSKNRDDRPDRPTCLGSSNPCDYDDQVASTSYVLGQSISFLSPSVPMEGDHNKGVYWNDNGQWYGGHENNDGGVHLL